MDDDFYFWSKSRNIIFRRDIVRNASAHLGMAHLKTDGVLIKTVHVSSEDGGWTEEEQETFEKTLLRKDLTPCTIYSLNKRKRWETEWGIGERLLEDVNEFHKEMVDVVFLERVNLKTFEWRDCSFVRFPEDFLIRSAHRLKKDANGRSSYQCFQQKSIFGQTYSHFLDQNRKPVKEEKKTSIISPTTIVAYNFVRPPKNYMVLGEQCFVASNYGGRYPYRQFTRRIENWEDALLDIRYADSQDESYDLEEDLEENSEKHGQFQTERANYYNLYEHLLDDFVFVKCRRPRKYRMKKDQSST